MASTYQAMPKITYGFNHFIHRTKEKMSIVDNLKDKTLYHVVNPTEHMIKDYEQDLERITQDFFKISGKKPDILSRAFYKMWEIASMFDLIPGDKNFVSAHLAEGPGSFLQSVILYRQKVLGTSTDMSKISSIDSDVDSEVQRGGKKKTTKGSKNKKPTSDYFAITLHRTGSGIPDFQDKFIKYYEDEKNTNLYIHPTYPQIQKLCLMKL